MKMENAFAQESHERMGSSAPAMTSVAPRPRGAALLAFAPLIALAVTGVWGMGQRALADHVPNGGLNRPAAEQLARKVCYQLTGSVSQTREASLQYAYSRRRGSVIREWNLLCDTADGQYLLRINANSGRLYAINRVSDTVTVPDVSASPSNPDQEHQPAMTRRQAEQQARHYLSLMGISVNGLKPVLENNPTDSAPAQWNFTFRRYVPGMGDRLLKVSVRGTDGQLEDAWNPVYAL